MSGALDRFTQAARSLGIEPEVHRFPEGTKTAQDAATAIGVDVGQIVKSLIFTADEERPVLALTSGSNRVDEQRLAVLAGAERVRRATPEEARTATGFAVGGTPPLSMSPGQDSGSSEPPRTFIDEALMQYDELWAAAGTPDSVFSLTPDELVRISGGTVATFSE